ncbi:hypothetical protein [Nocardioides sp. TF02-7]|uniref:hypothetical protein n=1 Tax=Nocardioides sp. TF02-7 TaxID=2917724 RepID=UPI001F055539|nr:hypothetical protein [Nocardioides sp. TF02-7]UMG94988.1 hypothetical protein MF408_22675 [Nocardioides sp. TF02-7]
MRFLPEAVEPAADHADALWGGGAEEQVTRGVARVQAMVGYDAVRVPVLQGGRGVADRQAQVPWGRPVGLRPLDRPWPGRVPGPAPARVFAEALPAEVVDADGRPVGVTERGVVSGEPARFRVDARADTARDARADTARDARADMARDARGRRWWPVTSWAGPWPVDEGWWLEEGDGGLAARFQVVGVDGRAWLLVCRRSGWELEAAYD